jgi:hypothetical protein
MYDQDKFRRSTRIHNRERVRRNFECLLANAHSQSDRSKVGQWARYDRDNRTTCSSWCCGNPRKWFKETTMQERKAALYDAHKYEDEEDVLRYPDDDAFDSD